MWGKVLGKVMDICLASSLISLSAVIVVKAVKEIKITFQGEKNNGSGDPE